MWTWQWILACFIGFVLMEAAAILYLIHCDEWSLRQWFVDLGEAIRNPMPEPTARMTVQQHAELLESSLVYRVRHMAATRGRPFLSGSSSDSSNGRGISSLSRKGLQRSPRGKSIQLLSGSQSNETEPSGSPRSEEKSEG